MRTLAAATFAIILAALAAGCGGSTAKSTDTTATAQAASCDKSSLELVTPGQLTIGTDNPAYPPWFGGSEVKPWKISNPASGQGFESAVAYAVAKQLGFSNGEVKWIVVPFNNAFRPGPKDFDFDINQISYAPERAKAVDFSDSYYDVNQSLVAQKGAKITSVKTVADLKGYKLGAQIGTTSYKYIVNTIKPTQKPSVYDTSNDTISGLKAKQIDGIVVDLPTGFYISAVEVPNGVIVGQFPTVGTPEHFGMVFQKGNSLVGCVNKALSTLRSDGTLAKIQTEWLSSKVHAPVLR
jgi:polar amino acid transport system substrate-binding protein